MDPGIQRLCITYSDVLSARRMLPRSHGLRELRSLGPRDSATLHFSDVLSSQGAMEIGSQWSHGPRDSETLHYSDVLSARRMQP
jgi:hypothetical protein